MNWYLYRRGKLLMRRANILIGMMVVGIILISSCQSDNGRNDAAPTLALEDRAVIALQNMADYESYIQTTNEYVTTQIIVKVDDERVYFLEREAETSTVSHVIISDAVRNISAEITSMIRDVEHEDGESSEINYGLEAELRLVDDTLFMRVNYDDSESEFSSLPPEEWIVLTAANIPAFDGADTLGLNHWINLQNNNSNLVGRMGERMLSLYGSASTLTSIAEDINRQTGTLEDGTSVDVIRFFGEELADGVANTIPFDVSNSDAMAVLQAGIQFPTIAFTIDKNNQMRNRIISYNVVVENIDGAVFGIDEANAGISIIMTVNIVEVYADINSDLEAVEPPILSE